MKFFRDIVSNNIDVKTIVRAVSQTVEHVNLYYYMRQGSRIISFTQENDRSFSGYHLYIQCKRFSTNKPHLQSEFHCPVGMVCVFYYIKALTNKTANHESI
jgi:hypothetical protein